MELFWQIIFWLSLGLLLHSYLFFPMLMSFFASRKQQRISLPKSVEEWPDVSVIMAVFNEELVLPRKLETIFASDYPKEKLHVWIGSDHSTDQTNEILESWAANKPNLNVFPFSERRGKQSVVNDLATYSAAQLGQRKDHVFIMTDANVMLEPTTLRRLVRHFQRPDIGLVDAHMVNTGLEDEGISRSEQLYISREVQTKHDEGQIGGFMMGPFGGCYALRSDLFSPVPPHFLVDDFYIAMRVFEQGQKAVSDLEALCFEAGSHEIREEYKRKKRIAAGNFQNMFRFSRLWFPPVSSLSFAFFSHKILRWLGPAWILLVLLSSGFLCLNGNLFFCGLFFLQIILYGFVPLVDYLLFKSGIHIQIFRNVRYFLAMNLAMMEGFFKFLKGIKEGTWDPPKRVQS
jgi:cellulose synthase/poly-beta-1,6-N-acetylglucosamine synthase-like glycosyltransferase